MLEVERGRHTRPITPLHKRLCPSCNEIEYEKHFVLDCPIYKAERNELYDKIHTAKPSFVEMMPDNKFVFLHQTTGRLSIGLANLFTYALKKEEN